MVFGSIGVAPALAQLPPLIELRPNLAPGTSTRYEVRSDVMVQQELTTTPQPDAEGEAEAAEEAAENAVDRRTFAGSLVMVVRLEVPAGAEVADDAESVATTLVIESLTLEDGDPETDTLELPAEGDNDPAARGEVVGRITGENPTRVSGLADLTGAAREAFGSGSVAASLLEPTAIAGLLEPLFNADGAAPGKRVGYGWENEEEIELPPVALLTLTRQYKLGEPDGGTVPITMTLEGSLSVSPPEGSLAPTIAIREAIGSGETIWHHAHGHLGSREATQRIVTTWTLGSNAMVNTQTSTQRHAVLDH